MDEFDFKKRTKWAIDYICNKEKLTNKSLADALGFKVSTLSQYRAGRIKPPFKFTSMFCKKYNIDEPWLYSGKGEPFPGARLQYPEMCGPAEPEETPSGQDTDRQAGRPEAGLWRLEAEPPETGRNIKEKDQQYPTYPNSSFDLAKAMQLAAGVLGSGTSYAYALFLNVIHFDRAIQAESRITVLEKKCEELEKLVRELMKKVETLEAENRELRRQLNLMRESREQSEDLNPASGGSA